VRTTKVRGVKRGAARATPRSRRPSAREERLKAIVAELRDAAETVGIRVREERLMREVGYHPHSGLCRFRGEEVLLIDWELPADLQIELLVAALDGHDLDRVALSEDARRLVGKVARFDDRPSS
jgi:hypothetical protein